MKIALLTLILAASWTAWLASIEQSPGIHSTPGICAIVLGLPGVLIAGGISGTGDSYLAHAIMFFVNWFSYLAVILGFAFLKRKFFE